MNNVGTEPWRRGWIQVVCLAAISWVSIGWFSVQAVVLPLWLYSPDKSVPGQITLSWEVPGEGWHFTVEVRSSLDANWEAVPGEDWPIESKSWSGPIVAIGDNPDAGTVSHFYRVRAEPPPVDRGRLVSATQLSTLGTTVLTLIFQELGAPLVPIFPVQVYRILYETVDPFGLLTIASGVLAVPVGATHELAMISYQHGTVLNRSDVPSEMNEEGLIPVAYASDGYLGVAPDYLGLGVSPGFHPYVHAQSQATAVIDLLRAAKQFCQEQNIRLNHQLFLTGYSQGGHATLAAQRELEANHSEEFSITASAPMAGPYSLSEVSFEDMLSDRPAPNPYYGAYILNAYFQLYSFARDLSDLLAEPYSETIPGLFDGETGSGTINALLPARTRDALAPGFLHALQTDPQHPLRRALRENDLVHWTPQSPTRLYHCSGDQDVLPQNSDVAFQRFQELGAPAVERLDPMPGADHGGCVLPSFLSAKSWFDTLRTGVNGEE